ncbi:MAG TPA: DUF222 domain-containing protein [Mycobacteriales bacterium]|jgi:hypothetical protein|nr:DUF222 domain-containing protein [Mycobacteriales bacterium]
MDPELARLRRRTADRVAVAAEMQVGPVLVAELSRLQAEPMDASTAADLVALVTKAESWLAALKMVFTNDAINGIRTSLELASKDEAWMLAAQEIACAIHVAYPTAMSHVTLVERVAVSLGRSWRALDRGDITVLHLKAVEKATRNCSPRVAAAVDEKVIPLAVQRGWTPGEVTRAARRMVIALDPDGAKDRAASAKDSADVHLYPGEDETSTLNATGDAVKARQVMDAINDRAEAMGRRGDDRAVGVRRFDALADLVLNGTASTANIPVRGEVHVRIDLTTLLGLDDNPGELTGYGPITAETARQIATDSMLRRLVFDPLTGDTLDLGLRSYRPSAALRRLIEATYPTCGMPGCSRPSIDCEIDHRNERRDRGRTDRCNLAPLCKMHHQMKTKGRWKVDQNPDGSETWTSYVGRTYTKKPRHFDLPEPLAPEQEPPDDIVDRLPVELFDPNPPVGQTPLPEPPPLTDEEYEEVARALDTLAVMDLTFREWVDKHFDEARATGLVA